MIEIKDLLGRFDNVLLGEEAKIECIRNAISLITKIPIKKEEIEIKNNIIYLNIKPIYKSEIFLKQEEIFRKLSESFKGVSPTKIR